MLLYLKLFHSLFCTHKLYIVLLNLNYLVVKYISETERNESSNRSIEANIRSEEQRSSRTIAFVMIAFHLFDI